jgi:transposase
MLLWEEYLKNNPDGYRYTQFCDYFRQYQKSLDVSLRMPHKVGEKLFVDYAGQTMFVVDPGTGEAKEVQIFVSVLGASDYIFTEATPTQELPFFIGSHAHAFSFYGGVTKIVVPDNLKQGVTKACRYEPDINSTYLDMATYYGCVIIPARPAKPKDKAKVENAVLQVERWILAPLRNRIFFSLAELNEAMAELLAALNEKELTKIGKSRRHLFEEIDKPALMPLPHKPYEFATFKKARVNIDYHIEIDAVYYSAPYQLTGKEVEARFTTRVVEIYYRGRRITSHMRSYIKGTYVTKDEHRPKAHQKHLEWTPSRMIAWAKETGEATSNLVAAIFKSKAHPEQGYRACLGIIRLSKSYGATRMEAACKRALDCGAISFKSVKSILENSLDKVPSEECPMQISIEHENIRGSNYYR